MKKLLLTAAMLAVLGPAAHAAPQAALPEIMLGRWCSYGGSEVLGEGNYYPVSDEKDWEQCMQGDGYMTMHRTKYSAHETECRFTAIRQTGRKSAPHTKAYPHELVPIMRVVAQCWQEDTKYKAQFELAYWKGTLTIEFKR